MKCAVHTDVDATGYCRNCGKPMCAACARPVRDVLYCEDCLATVMGHAAPAPPPGASPSVGTPPVSPYAAPSPGSYVPPVVAPIPRRPGSSSPALAFILGLFPGLGAIYNGQYAKGMVHALVWGVLVSIASNSRAAHGLEPLFGMLVVAWMAYMTFEAYHTARKRRAGEPVD